MASLLRNVGVNMLTFVGGKAAAAVTGIILFRVLRPEASGIYAAAMGFAALFQALGDLGLGACLTKEVGAHGKQANVWFSRGLQAQVAQMALAGSILLLFLWLGGAKGVEPSLVLLAFLIPAVASLGTPVAAALQGLERFGLQGLASTATSLLNALALAVLLIWGQASPRAALVASLSAAVLGLLAWVWAAFKGGLRWKPEAVGDVAAFWRKSLPFAAVAVPNQLYVRVDQALLVWLLGTGPLGYYLAAVKLVDLSVPVLGALNGPLYARLASLHSLKAKAAKADAAKKLNLALRAMAALCLPIGVGGSLLAPSLVALLYGPEFGPTGPALAALVWVPVLIGIHSSLLHGLNAAGQTLRLAKVFVFNLILNVCLNLWLAPRYGIAASALISALCEAVNLAAAWVLARKAGLAPSLRSAFWPALPAALGLGALLLLLRAPAQAFAGPAGAAWVLVPCGALCYGLLLLIFGFMGADERALWQRLRARV